LTRCTGAFEYLIDILENDHFKSALSALQALVLFRADNAMLKRIQQAAKTREESVIREKFKELFSEVS